jgi:hypothetical protein
MASNPLGCAFFNNLLDAVKHARSSEEEQLGAKPGKRRKP